MLESFKTQVTGIYIYIYFFFFFLLSCNGTKGSDISVKQVAKEDFADFIESMLQVTILFYMNILQGFSWYSSFFFREDKWAEFTLQY